MVYVEVMPVRRFGFYHYSRLVFCINAVSVLLSYFVEISALPKILILAAVFISWGRMIYLAKTKEQFGLDRIFKYSTKRSKVIVLLSIIYTSVNFFVCMIPLLEGQPHIDNGVYCLWNHGFIREITKEEYDALMIVEGRFLTGHFLVFSALPVAYSSARKNILNSHRH